MLPVKHDLTSVKGEFITLVIGYSELLEESDLFACVRKYPWDEEYLAKFNITTSTEELASEEKCRITLLLDTNELQFGSYMYDVFIWAGDKPVKCLLEGHINIHEGISNRGK